MLVSPIKAESTGDKANKFNKTLAVLGTVLALTGTCLAAPHHRGPGRWGRGPAPMHYHGGHHHHHHGGHNGGWLVAGAAAVGCVLGALFCGR